MKNRHKELNEKLYVEGKEKYRVTQVFGENALTLLHVSMAMYAMWDVKSASIPVISLGYGIFVGFMLLIFLRKHLCTHCYYYGKTCHCGWSKLAKFYKEKSGDLMLAKKAAGVTWGVISAVPVIVTLVLIVTEYHLVRILLFVLMVSFSILQGVVHKKNCETCKMRNICPGSAHDAPQ